MHWEQKVIFGQIYCSIHTDFKMLQKMRLMDLRRTMFSHRFVRQKNMTIQIRAPQFIVDHIFSRFRYMLKVTYGMLS